MTVHHIEDPSWHCYAATVLTLPCGRRIDLRRPLTAVERQALSAVTPNGSFAVVTASNPVGRQLPADDNTRRMMELHAELRRRGIDWCPVAGTSPDGVHREESVAIEVSSTEARELALMFGQSAYFWFDGDRVWIHGAVVKTDPIPLPIEQARM